MNLFKRFKKPIQAVVAPVIADNKAEIPSYLAQIKVLEESNRLLTEEVAQLNKLVDLACLHLTKFINKPFDRIKTALLKEGKLDIKAIVGKK